MEAPNLYLGGHTAYLMDYLDFWKKIVIFTVRLAFREFNRKPEKYSHASKWVFGMLTLTGQWVGTISGTNSGDVFLDISDNDGTLRGNIEVRDKRFGLSAFDFEGLREAGKFQIQFIPRAAQPGTVITPGIVSGVFQGKDTIQGIWETELGTAGIFTASRVAAISSVQPESTTMSDKPELPHAKKSWITPLSLISLFLTFTEIVTGIAVTQASGGVQIALATFVILFPSSIAFAFFWILWQRPYVFYPPTEFGPNTGVAEYVKALGGTAPSEGGVKQRWLIGTSEKTPVGPATAGATVDASVNTEDKLAHEVIKYFAFKKMRYSDVSNQENRVVFNLGVDYGFNLFDGLPGISFLGYFHELDLSEIVARVRFLLNNIEAAYIRISQNEDLKQKEFGIRIIDQMSITLLVSENADTTILMEKINEYRPEEPKVPVIVVRPSEIRKSVQQEYKKWVWPCNIIGAVWNVGQQNRIPRVRIGYNYSLEPGVVRNNSLYSGQRVFPQRQ